MAKLSRKFDRAFSFMNQSMTAIRSHKFFLGVAGLALAIGSLTLAQAGFTKATPAVNGVSDTSVRVNSEPARAKSALSNKSKIKIESSQNSSNESNASAPKPSVNTRVTVNGHNVPVPKNGRVHKTIPSEEGSTSLDITVNSSSQGSASNSSSSSSNIQVFSHSSNVTTEGVSDD